MPVSIFLKMIPNSYENPIINGWFCTIVTISYIKIYAKKQLSQCNTEYNILYCIDKDKIDSRFESVRTI